MGKGIILRCAAAAWVMVALAGCAAPTPQPARAAASTTASASSTAAKDVMGMQDDVWHPIVAVARDAVVTHAPFKQYDPRTGRPNLQIGRTPGTACDAIVFLGRYLEHTHDAAAAAKREALIDWIVGLQARARTRHGLATVPSTPDAAPPENAYYYAIDAAICGAAVLEAFAREGDRRLLEAASGFGDALLALGREHDRVFAAAADQGGFCEYARPAGDGLAYACDGYVKNLVALGFLRELAEATGHARFAERARAARRFLLPGLEGGWEYADVRSVLDCERATCPVVWRRVPGPRHEPDRYVYGDTLAYALAGLHAYEGASDDVRRLYARFAGYRSDSGSTREFDGRIAWAGYMEVAHERPDPESAYYDLVTIGILSPLRRDLVPADDAAAWAFLEGALARDVDLSWGVAFDGQPIGIEHVDLVTLSTLGRAALAGGP